MSYGNGSQLKNPDISGAILTLSLSILNSQCVDGARDVRVIQLTPIIHSALRISNLYSLINSSSTFWFHLFLIEHMITNCYILYVT